MGNLFKKPSNSPVSTNLTEEDIQMLLANTSFDREQIHDWHRGFLVRLVYYLKDFDSNAA
jgi:hypothetical protein